MTKLKMAAGKGTPAGWSDAARAAAAEARSDMAKKRPNPAGTRVDMRQTFGQGVNMRMGPEPKQAMTGAGVVRSAEKQAAAIRNMDAGKAAPTRTAAKSPSRGEFILYRGEGPTDPMRRTNRPVEWFTTDRERAVSYAGDASQRRGVFKLTLTPEEAARARVGIDGTEFAVPKDLASRMERIDVKGHGEGTIIAPKTSPAKPAKPAKFVGERARFERDLSSVLDRVKLTPDMKSEALRAGLAEYDRAEAATKTTLKSLRAEAKAAGLRGYSKMKKADLQAALKGGPRGFANPDVQAAAQAGRAKTPTVKSLRADAAAKGIKGASRMNKSALMKALGKAGNKLSAFAAPIIGVGVAAYALTSGASPASAAYEGTDAAAGGALSNYDGLRKSGMGSLRATLNSAAFGLTGIAGHSPETYAQSLANQQPRADLETRRRNRRGGRNSVNARSGAYFNADAVRRARAAPTAMQPRHGMLTTPSGGSMPVAYQTIDGRTVLTTKGRAKVYRARRK